MKYSQRRRLAIKIAVSLPLVAALYATLASQASAVTISAGDVLVADPDFVHIGWTGTAPDFDPMQPSISKIDPLTGIREIVTSETKGGGSPLQSATQVVVDSLGRITVADPYSGALLRVDPATGDRTNLFNNSDPNQPDFVAISGIALDSDNSIVVLDHLSQTIFRTDPVTGIRTLISGPTRGSGPDISLGTGISLDPLGNIFVPIATSSTDSALFKIDPLTGDRSIVSGFGHGAGDDFFGDIRDLQVIDDHTAIAINLGRIFEVDLATGDRKIVAFPYPPVDSLSSIARLPDGRFAITDEYNGTVYSIDLKNSAVSLLSGNTPEFGQRLWMLQDTFVVGVPEPGAGMLFVTLVGFGACGLRPRRTCVKRANRPAITSD